LGLENPLRSQVQLNIGIKPRYRGDEMRLQEPISSRPILGCTVRGHEHHLLYIETVVQETSGLMARLLECTNGRYRFFYLRGVSERVGMARSQRPRWGWPK
jgi:hypothetical protein